MAFRFAPRVAAQSQVEQQRDNARRRTTVQRARRRWQNGRKCRVGASAGRRLRHKDQRNTALHLTQPEAGTHRAERLKPPRIKHRPTGNAPQNRRQKTPRHGTNQPPRPRRTAPTSAETHTKPEHTENTPAQHNQETETPNAQVKRPQAHRKPPLKRTERPPAPEQAYATRITNHWETADQGGISERHRGRQAKREGKTPQ
jgi:hypothetical protein